MAIIAGQVNGIPNNSYSDGANYPLLQGKAGEAIIAELHGKYYTQAYRGNVFVAASAAGGLALTTSASTTMTFGVWNPLGSGKLVVPIKTHMGYVTGTGVAGAICYTYATGLGSSIATGAPISAKTGLTAINCNLGSGNVSIALPGSAFTLASAGTIARFIGASEGAPITSTAAIHPMIVDDFDGNLIIAPGSALFLSCVNQALAVNWAISMVWEEIPV
jgi:hypothetical protein